MLIGELPRQLITWIRNTVNNTGCTGVVLGMSGGIDSSVVAVLCKYAFPDNMLGIIMPCYSNDTDREHAQNVADKFTIPVKTVDLDEVYTSFKKAVLSDSANMDTMRLAESNVKPRLRMATLYYHANLLNHIVAGATNKSELETGYFTKYGDGGVDIMPIAMLVKTQVQQLAVYLGIPPEIINKAPSAGLWEGQADEREMGLTYEELDRYVLTGEGSAAVKARIDMLFGKNRHKKSLPIIPDFTVE
jgi:NAD+ synthase